MSMQDDSSPVSSLVDDVLTEIFHLVKLSQPCSWEHGLRTRTSWMAVAHVCHRWRTLALSFPCLWTSIEVPSQFPRSNLNVNFVETFLTRSVGMAIEINLPSNFKYSQTLQAVELLSPHAARIRILRMNLAPEAGDAKSILEFVSRVISTSSTLQQFQLSARISSHIPLDLPIRPPLLRTVELSNITVSWGSIIFADLTTLKLSIHRKMHPSVQELMQMLKNCPRLEVLRLSFRVNYVDLSTNAYPRPECQVELTELRSLDLVLATEPDVTYLLSHMTLPPTVNLLLECTDRRRWAPLLLPFSVGDLLDTLSTVRLAPGGGNVVVGKDAEDNPRFILSRSTSNDNASLDCRVDLQTVRLPNLQRLLVLTYLAGKRSWLWLLLGAPKLAQMCLGRSTCDWMNFPTLLNALCEPQGDGSVVCPQLSDIYLVDPPLMKKSQVDALASCLRERAGRGAMAISLTILLDDDGADGEGVLEKNVAAFWEIDVSVCCRFRRNNKDEGWLSHGWWLLP